MGNVNVTPRKEFSLEHERYPQNEYWGRFWTNLDMMDPTTLLASDDDVDSAVKMLAQFKDGTLSKDVTDEQLWEARHLKEATVHPDLGTKVNPVFRMSSFVLANIPICGGMVLSTGTKAQLFWQWANQSWNAGWNYCNRNASGGESEDQLLDVTRSYLSATVVACTVAFTLGRVASRVTGSPLKKAVVSTFVPFTAVATAGSFNAGAMRYKEALHGVELVDAEGNMYGKSVIAGKECLTKVCLTRVVLPVPILLVPPVLLSLITKAGVMPTNRVGKAFWEVLVMTVCLWGALPAAISLFPQRASIAVEDVEPKFQSLLHPVTGKPILELYYNKGI